MILFGLLLYVPFAGTYGLFDPWETHYGEVARQMTVRGDYISLWWPGAPLDADHFWSKPVLSFWLMSLFMRLFGIGGARWRRGSSRWARRAEWAARLPFCLMGVLGLWARLPVRLAASSVGAPACWGRGAGDSPLFSLVRARR